jgi:ubiquinone biosynthesis protein COQ9
VTAWELRRDARDAAIGALLPLVPDQGWTLSALRAAAGSSADLLFPGGAAELVEAYIDYADRRMVESAAPLLASQRLSERVRTLIATRLELAAPHRHAIRRGLAVLARPGNAVIAASCTSRTVDAIWAAAGDTAADFSWYTKRAILASVYASTLLFWLNDANDLDASLAFLDRRLAGVARLGKLRRRLFRSQPA